MAAEPYLQHLAAQLAAGVSRLPPDCRARHAAFVHAAQNPDGGFPGRDGVSDLYYTGFALRTLAVLDALSPEIAARVAAYLRDRLRQPASVVDFFSLLYACLLVQVSGGPDVLADSPSDWPERVAAALETFRTPDGGYARVAGGGSGSTYHTFLVGLCYQLLGRSCPRLDEVVRFIRSRRRDDGGFVEIAPMRRGGTNPTAAAIGMLQMAAAAHPNLGLTPDERAELIDFLAGMASEEEGGLRANRRAPLADLLSTFTGVWTLHELGALDRIDRDAGLRYARSLERPGGSFHGGLWDEGSDLEYAFYGVGTLALLG
jgi:geranylgeranyl transferase type-2 subunit beta